MCSTECFKLDASTVNTTFVDLKNLKTFFKEMTRTFKSLQLAARQHHHGQHEYVVFISNLTF